MSIAKQVRGLLHNRLMMAFNLNIVAVLSNVVAFQLFVQPILYADVDSFQTFNQLYYSAALLSGLTGTVALYLSLIHI